MVLRDQVQKYREVFEEAMRQVSVEETYPIDYLDCMIDYIVGRV